MQGNKGKESNATQSDNRNRYEALNVITEEDDTDLRILKGRTTMDSFLNKKVQPSEIEAELWAEDMHKYFKDQWEIDRLKEQEDVNENKEDVYDSGNGIAQNQYAVLIEEYERMPNVFLLWQKEKVLVEELVNNKRIPTIEETKIWPLRMFGNYKERWETKWNTECPFIGKFQE
ncbi:hypothetical protein CTI12_AA396990 [Artemisia annua]|uniref:Uncharacterized protein n=1 Tax=Artemisia annua TaxID=35608 RepID=A0A2U1MC39_ARTAN|nr:hypothetical protein CTI12_AA396990 [Artemisia annua]